MGWCWAVRPLRVTAAAGEVGTLGLRRTGRDGDGMCRVRVVGDKGAGVGAASGGDGGGGQRGERGVCALRSVESRARVWRAGIGYG